VALKFLELRERRNIRLAAGWKVGQPLSELRVEPCSEGEVICDCWGSHHLSLASMERATLLFL